LSTERLTARKLKAEIGGKQQAAVHNVASITATFLRFRTLHFQRPQRPVPSEIPTSQFTRILNIDCHQFLIVPPAGWQTARATKAPQPRRRRNLDEKPKIIVGGRRRATTGVAIAVTIIITSS